MIESDYVLETGIGMCYGQELPRNVKLHPKGDRPLHEWQYRANRDMQRPQTVRGSRGPF